LRVVEGLGAREGLTPLRVVEGWGRPQPEPPRASPRLDLSSACYAVGQVGV
jgi:hypothetical protein